jgi:nickel-type superoxide dismutase maturation protease
MRVQRYHSRRRRSRALGAGLALGGLAALTLGLRPFRVAVQGESMRPTLAPGDFLVALGGLRPRRGALVVVEHPERPGFEVVKRVVGLPGDRVGDRPLAPGELWVEGDHPGASTDSRAFGPVPAGAVRGVVVLRYWPLGRAGWLWPGPGRGGPRARGRSR